MSDLSEFLLARIAEDEEAWRGGLGLATRPDFSKLSRHMLADCEAKRRVVDMAERFSATPDDAGTDLVLEDVLRLLALPYADHPDYQQEWRP